MVLCILYLILDTFVSYYKNIYRCLKLKRVMVAIY